MDPDTQARARALAQTADDSVRAAQRQLAARLRILANASTDLALELELAGPRDRITSYVAIRYQAVRDAITHLEAVREGAAKTRQEASRLVQQRSA